MMDDCVLDDVPFWVLYGDVSSSRPQGWSEPLEYGCLARVDDVREEGFKSSLYGKWTWSF